MRTLLVLIILIALGAGLYWYTRSDRAGDQLRQAEDKAVQRADQVKTAIQDKLKGISLNTSDIKEELERTGKVVRKKAEQVGAAIADATADARITATIKAKLVKRALPRHFMHKCLIGRALSELFFSRRMEQESRIIFQFKHLQIDM
jgi:hypothetical protein